MRGYTAVCNNQAGFPSQYEKYIPDWNLVKDRYNIQHIKQMYIDACAMYNDCDSDQVGLTAFRTHYEKLIWKKEWFDDTVELPFENTSVSCPKGYDELLTKQFGDWRTPVSGSAMHEMFVVDAETPYVEFLKAKR